MAGEIAVWCKGLVGGGEGRGREGRIPEDGEADVDEEIGAAAGDEEDAEGGDCGCGERKG